MDVLNGYLGGVRELLELDVDKFQPENPRTIVLGNEACDLDSAVSSLCMAFYIHMSNFLKQVQPLPLVYPVFNIDRKDLPLKTEVTYWLRRKGIDLDRVVCRDEIDLERLKQQKLLQVVLVDHHHSPWADFVTKVIDHRPLDPNANLPENCEKRIELVGSCATLVADTVFSDEFFGMQAEMAKYLYEVIILDTVNFSKDADRARELDFQVIEKIEKFCEIEPENAEELRKNILNELVYARSNIAHLTVEQLLRKDLKIIKNEETNRAIAIPGFPLLVTDFIKMENAENAVRQFAEENKVDVIVLMGMRVNHGEVTRDLGLINISEPKLFGKALTTLIDFEDLDLEARTIYDFMGGDYFDQHNIKASRKQILPAVKEVLDNFVPPVPKTEEEKQAEADAFLTDVQREYNMMMEESKKKYPEFHAQDN